MGRSASDSAVVCKSAILHCYLDGFSNISVTGVLAKRSAVSM
jgi:hypothetical protein